MEMHRDSRGFPGAGSGASVTPHSKSELEMTQTQTLPSLPARHEDRFVRLPNGIRAVVHCWPQRQGEGYVDVYTIHSPVGTCTMAEGQIRTWWDNAHTWHPSGEVHSRLMSAKQDGRRYADVLMALREEEARGVVSA